MQVTNFQSMLMVGTLRCRILGQNGDDLYNAFVTKQRDILNTNNYVLKAHFLREAGIQGGRDAYDRFATATANHHSSRVDDPSFCATVAAYARLATSATSADLVTLARSVSELPDGDACEVQVAAAAPPVQSALLYANGAMPAPPPPAPDPAPLEDESASLPLASSGPLRLARGTPEGDAPPAMPAVPVAAVAQVDPDTVPEPVEVAATTPAAPAPAEGGATSAQALQTAIAALQAAAAALQAQQTGAR